MELEYDIEVDLDNREMDVVGVGHGADTYYQNQKSTTL
jgi:hypothetical protein